MAVMKVPFVDLKAQFLSLKDEFDVAIAKVVSETAFIGGRYATAFEMAFAQFEHDVSDSFVWQVHLRRPLQASPSVLLD